MNELSPTEIEIKTTQLLKEWLRTQSALFKPKEPDYLLIANHVFRAQLLYKLGGVVVDPGGGITLVNAVLAQLGMKVFVVDFLEDYWSGETSYTSNLKQTFDFLRSQGVQLIKADLTQCDLGQHFAPDSVDRITTNHTLEHFHASPRKLLESCATVLKDGGLMVHEVPNALNLLKRLKVLCGKTNYPDFESFYHSDHWTGHVREYSTGDLETLARILDLGPWRVFGRNWHGALYFKVRNRPLAGLIDRALQVFPGLCGSLFLTIEKSPAGRVRKTG